MRPFTPNSWNAFEEAAAHAVAYSHSFTTWWKDRRHPGTQPPEEDYVASLILHGLPLLDRLWRPLLQQRNVRLSLTGVFCHQTPKARYARGLKTESPELADLLIVRRHTDKQGQSRQHAVLIQAKMSDDGHISLPKRDAQQHLYTTWPAFELIGKHAPDIRFSLGRHEHQARYAAIAVKWPSGFSRWDWHWRFRDELEHLVERAIHRTPVRELEDELIDHYGLPGWTVRGPWGLTPPMETDSVDTSLSSFLVELLAFKAGREFFDVGTTGCHWTELVHYLLRSTFALPLRTRDIRMEHQRGVTISFNRMAFMSGDRHFSSTFVPAERVREIGRGGGVHPPEERQQELAEDGEGRVILIETADGQGVG